MGKGMVGFVHSGVTAHTSRLLLSSVQDGHGMLCLHMLARFMFHIWVSFLKRMSVCYCTFLGLSEHCDCFIPTNLQVLWCGCEVSSCLSLLIHRASALQLPLMG